MNLSYLNEIEEFEHHPTRRRGTLQLTEMVFVDAWTLYLSQSAHALDVTRNVRFGQIMGPYGHHLHELDAQIDSVVASVMAWLGSEEGQGFLARAKKLALHEGSREAYLTTWTRTNIRGREGYRQLEVCTQNEARDMLRLRQQDYEAVECLMLWLGSSEGEVFRMQAEIAVGAAQREEQLLNYLRNTLSLEEDHVRMVLTLAEGYPFRK